MANKVISAGCQFGKWTALEPFGQDRWTCRCACGDIHNVISRSLTRGQSTQCLSCKHKSVVMDRTPTWKAFLAALQLDCAFVMMPRGEFSLVDEDDLERCEAYDWHAIRNNAYAAASAGTGRQIYLHRFILNAQKGEQIDHKNKNKLDNRKSNIRFCNWSQNIANRGKMKNNSTSRFKGVAKRWERWTAKAIVNGERFWLGTYDTEREAAAAYNKFALEHHGEFACLNQL